MYDIAVSAHLRLIEASLGGLMTVDEVGHYIVDLKREFIRNKMHPGYRMVIDVCDCPIQPQHIVRVLGEHMASMPKASAIAVVTGSSLARMQVRRLFTQPYARIVATVENGRRWVLDGIEPPSEVAAI